MANPSTYAVPRKLWEHPDPESSNLGQFRRRLERKTGLKFPTFLSLYDYSVDNRAAFWDFCWHDLKPIHSGSYTTVVDETARMDSVPEWFAGTYMNFAENMLFASSGSSGVSTVGKEDEKSAVTEVREGGAEGSRNITFGELRRRVGKLSQAMKAAGVKKGDRVAVVASNSIDTLVVFLAVTALGGLFSSSSTDMGVKGILDRLLQIKPQWLFMDDWTVYNGKTIDLRPKMKEIVKGMEAVEEFQGVVSQARFQDRPADVSTVPRAQTFAAFLSKAKSDKLEFERVKFSDPFLIVYSSGTTGTPKCIVHSVGGVVLTGLKEGKLHREMQPTSAALQYTTTGWIMYLSALQPLMYGCRVVLYDGSPFLPDVTYFIKLAGEQKVTHLGTSPRYMHELQQNGIQPREITDLSNLKVLTSTGMVLSDALFEWFYDKGFPANVQLANISGGTDIAGTFGTSNALTPLYVGGCQGPSLGTPIAVYDQTVEGGKGVKGIPLEEGVPGELVATAAFPNMPVMFWGENGVERYFDAYFGRFDDVWTHGDFIMIHPTTKQIFFLGRADGVLNPSGVRFGSSEVYSILENKFANDISDSICVGQRRPRDSDETVMLFLLMRPGVQFTKKLVDDVKAAIKSGLSARHVPKYVFETPEIPTTVNLKKVELPVKQIVSGKVIKPSGTLANPESLNFYYQFAEVEKLVAPSSKL
ncbi:acetoacetate-CoA ligase [[Emmonsia] crescens]|uniref:Acetoacetate-CoA ligase n=1 Tax=[Emmonsia] crescens TaxID=73230 RepID=A0A0G2I1K7_9EURO|nr:acetoacetate-CoA ligase [Emmonsia crescens UAMH 3008]